MTPPLPKPSTGPGPQEAGQNVSPTSEQSPSNAVHTTTTSQAPSSEKEDSLETFLKGLKKEDIVLPRSANLTDTQANLCLEIFATQQKLTPNQALTVAAALLQTGGTAKSCDGNLNIDLFGKVTKLAYLRKALTEAKCKGNERKLAKNLATKIAQIATTLEIPGNLAKKITRAHPERPFPMEELVWLSDFQVDNKDCPEILRKFITETFEARKADNKGSKNQNTNPKNKKTK